LALQLRRMAALKQARRWRVDAMTRTPARHGPVVRRRVLLDLAA